MLLQQFLSKSTTKKVTGYIPDLILLFLSVARLVRICCKQAIVKLKALPTDEQDTVASIILADLEDESLWDAKFAKSKNGLAKLAEIAMLEYREGKTQELDPISD